MVLEIDWIDGLEMIELCILNESDDYNGTEYGLERNFCIHVSNAVFCKYLGSWKNPDKGPERS